MKKSIITLILNLLFILTAFAQQGQVPKNDPIGRWKFELPDAPEGYKLGRIDVGFVEKKYSATMIFTDNGYIIPGEKVSFLNDSLLFLMYADGQEVNVFLKQTEPLKMEGKVTYNEGEFPLLLIKDITPE